MLTVPVGAEALLLAVATQGPLDVAEASNEEMNALPSQLGAP